jgi:hypothetical protein
MLASQTALLQVDLLHEIFGYIDAETTVTPVYVDSTWSDLFLNKIWRKLESLDVLLNILFEVEGDRGDRQVSLTWGLYCS